MVISKDFQDVPWYKRPIQLYLIWDQEYPLELLCFTPEELDKKKNRLGIVSTALESGIVI